MSTLNKKLNKVSRLIVTILRHTASNYNLNMDTNGFIAVDSLLKIPKLKDITIDEIKYIVNNCDKKRMILKEKYGKLYIAANQGHSIKIESELLTPITLENYNLYKQKYIIHGTYLNVIDKIKVEGLNKMERIHIHFTTNLEVSKVVSGMRKSSEVFIFIDLEKALQDGFKFYESHNGVILTSGNHNGVLPTNYFKKIIYRNEL
jgi:2'-phosphotransferase